MGVVRTVGGAVAVWCVPIVGVGVDVYSGGGDAVVLDPPGSRWWMHGVVPLQHPCILYDPVIVHAYPKPPKG